MGKKIVVDINPDGVVKAETFNFEGSGCLAELDRLLAELSNKAETNKKDDYYKEKGYLDQNIHVKNK